LAGLSPETFKKGSFEGEGIYLMCWPLETKKSCKGEGMLGMPVVCLFGCLK